MITKSQRQLSKQLYHILNPMNKKRKSKRENKDPKCYHNHQVRKRNQIKRTKRKNGEYSHTTTMIRSVIMRDPRAFTMVKMFIVVGRTRMQQKYSLLKVKLQDRKVTKLQ